jgi:hypothetical protein
MMGFRSVIGLVGVLAACAPTQEKPAAPKPTAKSAPATTARKAPAPGAPTPWGAPRPDAHADDRVVRALVAIANAEATAGDAVSDALVLGPALWSVLLELDKNATPPQVAMLGTDSKAVIPLGDGKTVSLDMRTFDANTRAQLLATQPFRRLAALFAGGTPRAADDTERHLLYALVPFEIDKRPVTVIDTASGLRLLVVLDNDRLYWLDVPNLYTRDFQIAKN